jgi:hypothetical protein
MITRRELLKLGLVVGGSTPFVECAARLSTAGRAAPVPWPVYVLSRERDELYLELVAVGYQERSFLGSKSLEPVPHTADSRLVFRLPPQHYAETAIQTTRLPSSLEESLLRRVKVIPSARTTIVFRVPHRKRLGLTLRDLLAWDEFDLVLPDLNVVGQSYDLGVTNRDDITFTQIELPWGIDLTPIGQYGQAKPAGTLESPPPSFLFDLPIEPRSSGEWVELWTAGLHNSAKRDDPIAVEVLDARGFIRGATAGSAATGKLVVKYTDAPGVEFPEEVSVPGAPIITTPLGNLDRIEIAASLSRRFPYTGQVGPPPIETAVIAYESPLNPLDMCVSACYAVDRTVAVDEFRLSARGGWLSLDGKWTPFPSCALTGWKHEASLGRDHHVEVIRAGFLFPFGTEAELIFISERAFVKDPTGHYVAVLLEQVFIQIPHHNVVHVDHIESIFRSITVTTKRTPPLDIPPSGRLDDYRAYDFFTPTVDGKPFEFEHTGTDWAGDQHAARMPMFFISNKARSANGLIWEEGHCWRHTQQAAKCGDETTGEPDAEHRIPKDGDGLRVIDKMWNLRPYRFAQYGDALIAMAPPSTTGDTSHRVEWVEWTRGPVASTCPTELVARPFQPRSRTMKVRLQGMGQFSGEGVRCLVTFRDTRFTAIPLMDPEPTAPRDLWARNLPADSRDVTSDYIFALETRDLIGAGPSPQAESPEPAARRIRSIYHGVSINPHPVPEALFYGIDNEVRFGTSKSAEATGGLSVPDTHVSTATRRTGPQGDATFNRRRWPGYTDAQRTRLAGSRRLDYAAFRLAHRANLDLEPFDRGRTTGEMQALVAAADAVMGFSARIEPLAFAATDTRPRPQLNLGEMFGADAQVLPGLSFADLFRRVPATTSATPSAGVSAAPPLAWQLRVTGLEWLISLIGTDPGQLSIADLVEAARVEGQNVAVSTPISFGVEARLDWSNDAFEDEDLGPVKFRRNSDTRMDVHAVARVELGLEGLPDDLSQLSIDPARATITSSAVLRSFRVMLFDAIEIDFSQVAFTLHADGRKEFNTSISNVTLTGPLSFINQLSDLLSGLGDALGIQIDISPARVRISQTLTFPPKEGDPLFIGPAQVTNLTLGWAVMIPLIGRDVLSASFGLSSREKPLMIFVPPWYGGKAHILLEVTTRGIRLLEISMEYGALIPVSWGIAHGEASLMAGIFYMVERAVTPPPQNADTGRVVFKAFVKATANLDVAGIIHFCGLIYIALDFVEENSRRLVIGEATVSVSVKIGFVRFSYSFSATHVEESGSQQLAFASLVQPRISTCEPTLPPGTPGDIVFFGPQFDDTRRQAFTRILLGYVS